MNSSALAGLRVIEVGGRVAVAYAGKLLAELGAAVVKVEPVNGDRMRRQAENGDLVAAGFFSYLNAGKRAVAVDLESPAGQDLLRTLLGRADIVLTDRTPAALPEVERAADRSPAARVHVTDYGLTGPWCGRPATGLTIQAAAGWVIWRGQETDEPVQVGGEPNELIAGVYVAVAALVAMRARARGLPGDGSPLMMDVSAMEALHGAIPFHEVAGGVDPTMLDLAARPFPLTIMKARDGWVGLNCLTGQQWHDACALLGVPEYADRREELRADPVFLNQLRALVQPWFDAHTVAEIVELAQAFRIPAAELATAETTLRSPHLRERGFFVANEVLGHSFEQPGAPYRFSVSPMRTATGIPPLAAASDVDADNIVSSAI